MRGLQAIGMGLVLVALRVGEPDLLPDPVGWLLVLVGVRRLPRDLPRRTGLLVLGSLALAVSVPLWVPSLADHVLTAHPSLQWALNLPQLGFVLVLAASLGRRAGEAGDRGARSWWLVVAAGTAAAAVLPVLVHGGGVDALGTPSIVLAGVVLLTTIALAFTHAGRPWIRSETTDAAGP
ncbi:hypothetical protein [Nocardioides coralli]|uniref:hypothetical protein n=1 Tax=Nocardioides coralli TaxID=2872154 RepID=UPI001CA3AB25|nr:hypothetical protein [Nocardioides coralli]QZY29129.1 hypothetical protein K6T13_17155 [Nocardioides coralli]